MGLVILFVILAAAVASVVVLVRQVNALHRTGTVLTDRPGDAHGVSPAAMIFVGNSTSR